MPLVGEVEPGLFCSLAHGTRGLLTTGIAGDIIAAQIAGQLPSLPDLVLEALSPKRLRRNKNRMLKANPSPKVQDGKQ
jgi:tRNA 5-methylaminomethyl-2-thiouridine biosynthesis bifunctional protein